MRSLIALVASFLICLWPAQYALKVVARPVLVAMKAHNQPTTFLSTGPLEGVIIYLKMVLALSLIIAGPYIIYQIWHFVAQGLYTKERQWVYKMVPFSIGLFLLGVAFMYFFVLVISLHFLIGFTTWFPMPNLEPTFIENMVIGEHSPTSPVDIATDLAGKPGVAVLSHDPENPIDGAVWVNRTTHELRAQIGGETYAMEMTPTHGGSMMLTHFRFSEYISFLLVITIAFGLAFQSPLVVLFLTVSNLVPLETMRKSRRMIILLIVIVAAFLSPADLMSHVMLSTCMILLFEAGMLLSARYERKRAAGVGA
ncbi:MAG: preprotein translocase subunit TatC [Phycisphaerales bacterium]|nr:preprotein translocase subunit TatC [Phycisphaerales bacterium]